MAKKDAFKQKPKPKKESADVKKKVESGKMNPFEMHINKSKYAVVGQKRKEDRGLPGISKARALKKRENTLLSEYKSRHKSNVFVDRRIGENDATLDPEKKLALRLAAVKIKQSNRKSMFNLNDDDILTHGGKALDDDNWDDKMGFSDEEDDQILDAEFVKERHFGGGFLKKRETEDGHHKSKKEVIDDIIAESKLKKAEAKKNKEEQFEAVSKLDSSLKSFLAMMSGNTMTDDDRMTAKKTCEFRDYDMLVKELTFDRSGKAKTSSRLKTPEELIKEEKEKLQKLEADRVRRMQGKLEPEKKASKSADDLDDGFYPNIDNRYLLSYKDGEILKEDSNDDDSDDEETKVADEAGDEDKLEAEGNEEDNTSDIEDEDDENEDEDESDQYSDILDEDSDDNEGDDGADIVSPEKKGKADVKLVVDTEKKEVMEAARKELPYTFEVPQDYDAFWAVLENRSPKEVVTILERMLACNHPTLGGRNKEKFEELSTYILQTLNVLTEEDSDTPVNGVPPMAYIDSLIPPLYTITQSCSPGVANAFRQVIEEKYEDCSKFGFKRYPMADSFVFMKIAGVLFPPSDFVHPVMTPIVTFLTQLLGQAKVNTQRDVTAALFASYLLFEYLSLSRRFIPELLNAVNGLLSLAVEGKKKVKLPICPPFKRFGPSSEILVLEKPVETSTLPKLTLASLNNKIAEISENFKVNILYKTATLLKQLCDCWSSLPSIQSLMAPTSKLLEVLNVDNYPELVKETITTLKDRIASLPGPKHALVKDAKKPKGMKMYEPAIEQIIEGRKKGGSRDAQEKQKLLHKLKRERKGARREILRDTAFLARQQLKEQLQSDAERKRKVNKIMAGLQTQESEHKKMKLGK